MAGDTADGRRTRAAGLPGRRAALLALLAVVAVAAATAVWPSGLVAGDDEAAAVPEDALSGPGADLGLGLAVAPGSSLVGPVVVEAVDAEGEPSEWFAVVLVEGDPIDVWTEYARQVAELYPSERIAASQAPGCAMPGPDTGPQACRLRVDSAEPGNGSRLYLAMETVPGDVTGRYVLWLWGRTSTDPRLDEVEDGAGEPWAGEELPPPYEARPRPAVGEPLATDTLPYTTTEDRYPLLAGSELLVQYGDGGETGGFGVLLRTTPNADVGEVAAAYAQQAVQFAKGSPSRRPR